MASYSVPIEDGMATAYGNELSCSPKHCVEISREIKGMDLEEAKALLRRVQNEDEAIPFKRHNRGVGHRKGGGPGRFPVKAAGEVLRVLENAENNAEQQGMENGRLFISHVAAHRGQSTESFTPRAFGRATPKTRRTTNLEVILEER